MKERPILFSGPMVRAILEGHKTQTRRIVKIQATEQVRVTGHVDPAYIEDGGYWYYRDPNDWSAHDTQYRLLKCPYGKPGDQLWVREAWAWGTGPADGQEPTKDNTAIIYRDDWERTYPKGSDYDLSGSWKPSIFMPRWASRIQLEVTGVRVERLQDISRADAIAEGGPPSHPSIDAVSREIGYADDFSRSWYAQLWESINGEGSWDANPYVWVIEFKVVGR